jgi:hypothetical protein
MNSGASCLPVSSFPNANSFAQRRSGEKDEVLTTWDYIKSGKKLKAFLKKKKKKVRISMFVILKRSSNAVDVCCCAFVNGVWIVSIILKEKH